MLLVLDNFEQVVAAGPDVADLLRRCPNVACLVTTRIALHVSGEQEYPVPGLPAPPDTSRLSEVERLNLPRALREYDLDTLNQFEAVRLFIARAARSGPGSRSRTPMPRRSPASRPGSTACRSPSSSPPRGSSC